MTENNADKRYPLSPDALAGFNRWLGYLKENGELTAPVEVIVDASRFPSHYAKSYGNRIAVSPEMHCLLLQNSLEP